MKTNLILVLFLVGSSTLSVAEYSRKTEGYGTDKKSRSIVTDTTNKVNPASTPATKDTVISSFSINFIPSLNKKRTQTVYFINDVQFNILAGSSNGIRIAEIGGLFNHVKGNARSLQLAGLGNTVTDSVKGTQIAGLLNTAGKRTNGVQLAGLFNYAVALNGFQGSGLINVAKKKATATQLAGLINCADSLKGIQIAGMVNTVNTSIGGVQLAGIVNRADMVKGAQIAGLINTADVTNGFQLSGLINHTKKLNGVQLSVFNFADSCSGLPIGFFSYVKNGYHKIELTVDEILLTTIGFRIGTDRLHNVFFTGIKLSENPSLWTYGYGIGNTTPIAHNVNLNCEITSQQIQTTNNNRGIRLNLLNKLFLGVDYKILPKISVGAGPTYDLTISDVTSKDYTAVYSKIAPYSFYNKTHGDYNIKMWVGAKLSLKFL
jgi:hypothetical protein